MDYYDIHLDSSDLDGGAKKPSLSVSDAIRDAKVNLESRTYQLVGEVSEFNNKSGYKAVYFTVKDEESSLPCMMWMNRFQAAGIEVGIGQLVEITGRFTIYAQKGRLNFDVSSIKLAGEGDLRLRVANLAKKLQVEGLMDASRKKPIPRYPETIAVVTSPRGAAIHDVLRTLRRRYPLAAVQVCGVPVEGAMAPSHLIEGLQCAIEHRAEVILLVRGGGSFEDLMPFNDEALARAIAACPVPIVTGIGHEPDTSIADMVADLRASTPTAAAEAVSPSEEQMRNILSNRVSGLNRFINQSLFETKSRYERYSLRPYFADPHLIFADVSVAADALQERLTRRADYQFSLLEQDFSLRAARLHDLSPLSVLGRGYAYVRQSDGRYVKSSLDAACGDEISVALHDGALDCVVKNVSVENRF